MPSCRFRFPRKAVVGVLLASVFLGSALALDLLNSGKNAESALAQGEQLPSFANVAQSIMPAVVNISTTQKVIRRQAPPFSPPGPSPFGREDPFEEFFRRFFGDRPPQGPRRSLGSGFIISTDGYIVTNNHVIGDADKITVRLSDPHEAEYEATVVGADDKTDIALIKINANRSLPTIALGSSADLQVGDWVMAVGNPFGLEQTVTVGIVSAKGRIIGAGPYDNFIQTDASINPGNSGGPLLNLKGEVIGINTAIFSQSGGNIGIGFATPVDLAKSIVTQLREKGKVTRGWLGVTVQSVTPELAQSFDLKESSGALIAEVTPGGPADQAGLKRGDIITVFNGTAIEDSHQLPALVAETPVGEKARITVLRGGKEEILTVTVRELTDQQAAAGRGEQSEGNWGMTVDNLTPEVVRRFQLERDQRGVAVIEVEPGSPAEQAGIQSGDVLVEINRQPVESLADFTKVLADVKNQETLLLLVQRGDSASFFALRKVG